MYGIAHCGRAIGGLGKFVHPVLHDIGVNNADDGCRSGGINTSGQEIHRMKNEDERKRKIDQRRHRRRGDEVAYRFEGAQIRCERPTDAGLPSMRMPSTRSMIIAESRTSTPRSQIDEMPAQEPDDVIPCWTTRITPSAIITGYRRQNSALPGQVHVHREQRHDKGKWVDQKRSSNNIAINRPLFAPARPRTSAPQPICALRARASK